MTITKQNYVFIDFENTQAIDTKRLSGLPVRIVIFTGQNQKTLSIDLVKRLLEFQGAEIYESCGIGKNALDFQLAFYAGRIFEREPEAVLHIVSRDKGFDPLVAHIKSQKRSCSRVDNFSALPFFQVTNNKPTAEKEDYTTYTISHRVDFALTRFSKTPAISRPRKIKTLKSSLNSHFQKQLSEADIDKIVNELIARKHISIGASENVIYAMKA